MSGLFLHLTAAAALVGGTPAVTSMSPPEAPYVEIWTNRDDVFRRGDRVRVYFRTETDSYVTIFRVDTDGFVSVLFPSDPWDNNYVKGDRRYEVVVGNTYAFEVDDYPGQGYLFAVASSDPYDYSNYTATNGWGYDLIVDGGRIAGDPYVALTDIIYYMVPVGYSDYSYDVLPYYVEHRYDYPRFVCYDCHAYESYTRWDPYSYTCTDFRIVIYEDPYYYPARYYSGTRVVYQRPTRIEPRYVFRARTPGTPYIATERERVAERRVGGATSEDYGGRGSVPSPRVISERRRAAVTSTGAQSADRRSGGDTQEERQAAGPPTRRAAPGESTRRQTTPTLERRDPAKARATARPPAGDPRQTPQRSTGTRGPDSSSGERRVLPPTRRQPAATSPGTPRRAPVRSAGGRRPSGESSATSGRSGGRRTVARPRTTRPSVPARRPTRSTGNRRPDPQPSAGERRATERRRPARSSGRSTGRRPRP